MIARVSEANGRLTGNKSQQSLRKSNVNVVHFKPTFDVIDEVSRENGQGRST